MQRFRSYLFLATLLAPAALSAQTVTSSGTLAVAGGGALQEGDRAAFQRAVQHNKEGFFGIEHYELTREADDSLFKFEARILPGDEDYRVAFRLEVPDRYYVDGGYEQFRVWYDGSGGYFRPRDMYFFLHDEDLHLDRKAAWLELGVYLPKEILLRFRYDYRARVGSKDSTNWGDSVAPAPYGQRNIAPTLMDLDETTNSFAVDIGNTTQEHQKWNIGGRVQDTQLNNKRYMRRRPFDPAADRIVTTKDQTQTDMFAAHGYYLRKFTEKLTVSGGALISEIDTHLDGSRIYGQSYDPAYDPAYPRRQQRDEGFKDMTGGADLKQTILNLNGVYLATPNWSVRPSIRFENLSQEVLADFTEINTGAPPAVAPILEEVEAESEKDWNEFAESLEVRYTGIPNWTFNVTGDWVQGEGMIAEDRIVHHTTVTIDRDTDVTRFTQKYAFTANWYARPGLTFVGQYYYKNSINDYDTTRDNTPPGTSDRYPAYITDQDFETHDVNFRMSWRPVSKLNLVTRYDHQQSKTITIEAGLPKIQTGDLSTDIISQNITWSPTERLYFNGSVNVTFDQLKTPAYPIVQYGDNNYINGVVGAGYVVSERDDVYAEYTWFDADNYIDNSARSLPYGLTQTQQAFYLTWVRRQSENLVYTVKYGYVTNDDFTSGGYNDFDAHVLYAKVQYHF